MRRIGKQTAIRADPDCVREEARRRRNPHVVHRSLRRISIVMILLAGIVLAAALGGIWKILAEDSEAADVRERLQAYVHLQDSGEAAVKTESSLFAAGFISAGNQEEDGPGMLVAGDEAAHAEVDFAGLQQVNSDIVGWIQVPGTDISEPLLQGPDNEWYLSRSADGGKNRAGSIFLDARCERDLSSANTIIYGHRMNNGTMFAQLRRFEDPDFLKKHPCFCLWTADGSRWRCRIFDVSEVDGDLAGPGFRVQFADDSALEAWKSAPAGRSYYFTPPSPGRVITLITCVRGNGALRFCVRGVLEKEGEIE